MSVRLESKDDKEFDISISNGDFAALVACARAFNEDVPAWNGTHDGHYYSPEHLRRIANRAKQIGSLAGAMEELADQGGATVN